MFGDLSGASREATVSVTFRGSGHRVAAIRVPGPDERVRHVAMEHKLFSPQGPGRVYCDDGPSRPFATDASKFALFSAACAAYIAGMEQRPDVVHLHDWHSALYLLLREFDPEREALRSIRTVFTIHNLALQGIRPIAGDESSLASWFPALAYDRSTAGDPRYTDCINPMAVAIRLSDRLNTVSPRYAAEILRPNNAAHGFHGGEGLQADLQQAKRQGRLFGILNGCVYPKRDRRRPGWRSLLETVAREVDAWRSHDETRADHHESALQRLATLPKRRPRHLLVSIGRITDQKVALFLQPTSAGATALEAILQGPAAGGVLIMLGSGDPQLERQLAGISRDRDNFLFLCGFAQTFSEMLYKAGDLFLMPSTFEPCGISQMLAMRAGQPCVAHAVGGLRDTIRDMVDGFTFSGDTPTAQAESFVEAVRHALAVRTDDPDRWLRIREGAAAARFTWDASAMQYIGEMYE